MAKSQTFAFPTVNTDEYQFQDWSFSVTKGPIMKSICNCQAAIPNVLQKCHVCQYEKALKLPQLPEMIFPDNKLTLRHAGGAQMDFIGLDALQLVNAEKDENEVKVLASKKWTEARKDVEGIDNVAKPFDWTYTTRYSGTLNDRWKVTDNDAISTP